MVWEGVNITATLKPGAAQISLTPVQDTGYCCWGDRNIDTVLLHPNRTDIANRLLSVSDGQASEPSSIFLKEIVGQLAL
jgi:hypothetical protein